MLRGPRAHSWWYLSKWAAVGSVPGPEASVLFIPKLLELLWQCLGPSGLYVVVMGDRPRFELIFHWVIKFLEVLEHSKYS